MQPPLKLGAAPWFLTARQYLLVNKLGAALDPYVYGQLETAVSCAALKTRSKLSQIPCNMTSSAALMGRMDANNMDRSLLSRCSTQQTRLNHKLGSLLWSVALIFSRRFFSTRSNPALVIFRIRLIISSSSPLSLITYSSLLSTSNHPLLTRVLKNY